MSEPIVSVCLITYNHAKYIAQAIESVLMQETSFEWELVIADDFSTDGTREIIKEYANKLPNKIKLIFQEKNVGANKNWIDLLSYPKSKYIAYFEGDDYWIDKNKLQLQIDFLEKNPDYGLCHTNYNRLLEHSQKMESVFVRRPKTDYIFEHLISKVNLIGTLTVCFKTELFKRYYKEVDPINKTWKVGDLPFWIFISKTSKIFYLNEITCIYRVIGESASNSNNLTKCVEFEQSVKNVKLFFVNDDDKQTIKKINEEFEYKKLKLHIEKGNSNVEKITLLLLFFKNYMNIKRSMKSFYIFLRILIKNSSVNYD